MYATAMIFVLMGLMNVALTYHLSMKDNSKDYALYQTYKSISEISANSFVINLSSQSVNVNTDSEWLSVSSNARYTNALTSMTENITQSPEYKLWNVKDINNILLISGISNNDISKHINNAVKNKSVDLSLRVDNITLDWDNEENYNTKNEGHIALNLSITVTVKTATDTIEDKFNIKGLYIDMINNEGLLLFKIAISQSGGAIEIERV